MDEDKPTCPYDGSHRNTGVPALSGCKYYALCAVCGRKALVVIYGKAGGGRSYSLARVGRRSSRVGTVKFVRSVRLSNDEMCAVEQGKLHLLVINNRITLTV